MQRLDEVQLSLEKKDVFNMIRSCYICFKNIHKSVEMENSFPGYLGEHYPKTTTKASEKEDIYETSLSGTKHGMRCSSIFETKLPKVRKKAV